MQNAVVARARALGHQASRGSAVRVHCSLERGWCASDDTRMHIDRADGPLDKTELGQGVRRRCGGVNERRSATVPGSRASSKGRRGRGAYSASLSAALVYAAN
ncbi:hypothetical protein B0H13DRAFT_1877419 [Mycena leptocephala]|nr:hypothetical protein B0H13DRAFT_1877419 [Mycena leptocephala]